MAPSNADVFQIQIGEACIIVDVDDAELVSQYRWGLAAGYVVAHSNGVALSLHRLLLSAPAGSFVDHIDGDKLNNRRSNLRLCGHADNMKNRKPAKHGKSRFKGVHPSRNRWRVQISADGKKHFIGRFWTEIEAAQAYDNAALAMHGAFAKTNAQLGLY